MKKLVIDRKMWFRGDGGVLSALVRADDGRMCCLGFLGCSVGGDPKGPWKGEGAGMIEQLYPSQYQKEIAWPKWLFGPHDPKDFGTAHRRSEGEPGPHRGCLTATRGDQRQRGVARRHA